MNQLYLTTTLNHSRMVTRLARTQRGWHPETINHLALMEDVYYDSRPLPIIAIRRR